MLRKPGFYLLMGFLFACLPAKYSFGESRRPAQQEGEQCAWILNGSTARFEWNGRSWELPEAQEPAMAMASEQRLTSLSLKPLKLLKSSPLKDVYLVEWKGSRQIAKVYKAATLEKLNQALQRDYLFGEILPHWGLKTEPLHFSSDFARRGVVLQNFHEHLISQVFAGTGSRDLPVWAELMKKVVALEMNRDFKSWLQEMRKHYRNVEIDFRADNIAIENDGHGGWQNPVFIDW